MMKRFGLFVAALAVLVVAGCGGSTVKGEEALPDPTIKFVNAASDSGAIEFYLNDELKAANVNYLSASGPFMKVPFKSDLDGGYDLSSRVPGSQDDIDRISNLLERDRHYVAVTLGLLNPADGDEEKRARVALTEIDRVAPTGDKAHLYVLHAFNRPPGDETPQLNFQTPGDNPQFKLENLEFGGSQDIVVDSGFQTFEARRADVDGENVYASAGVTLKSGGIYFVIIGGIQDDPNTPPILHFIELEPK